MLSMRVREEGRGKRVEFLLIHSIEIKSPFTLLDMKFLLWFDLSTRTIDLLSYLQRTIILWIHFPFSLSILHYHDFFSLPSYCILIILNVCAQRFHKSVTTIWTTWKIIASKSFLFSSFIVQFILRGCSNWLQMCLHVLIFHLFYLLIG